MSLLERSYQEKRNFIRMKIDTPAEIILLDEDLQCQGVCHDLSGSGMLLTLDRAVAIGSEIVVNVSTSHGHQPMISARCHVARIASGPKESYLLGLEIEEILNAPEHAETV